MLGATHRDRNTYQRALIWLASHTADKKRGGLAKSKPVKVVAFAFGKQPGDVASDVIAFEDRARTGVNRTLRPPAHDQRHETPQPAEA